MRAPRSPNGEGSTAMIRAALIAILLAATLAFAGDTQKPACEPINAQQLQIQTKSEEWVHVVSVYMPVNIFKARHEAKAALHNKTVITKTLTVPAVKAKPAVKIVRNVQIAKKRKSGVCGSKRQVWYARANGHKMYRCK